VLENRKTFEDAIELWAVADLLASLLETLRSTHIETIDGQLSGGWINLSCHALEKRGLART